MAAAGGLGGCLDGFGTDGSARRDLAGVSEWPPADRGDALHLTTWHHFWSAWARPHFEREYDLAETRSTVYGSASEWYGPLREGEAVADVVHTTTRWAERAIADDLLAPLPTDAMPAWEDTRDRWDHDRYRDGGAVHAVVQAPMLYPLGYHVDLRHDPPTSWDALWDDAHAGEIVMPADGVLAGQVAALYTGQDPVHPDDLAAVEAALDRQQPLVGGYWEDLGGIWRRFRKGEAAVAPVLHSRLCLCAQDGAPFAWTVPGEGAVRTDSIFAVPRTAPNPRNGLLFADWAAGSKLGGDLTWDDGWTLHRAGRLPDEVRERYHGIWERVRRS